MDFAQIDAVGRLRIALLQIEDGKRARRAAVVEGTGAGMSCRQLARLVGDDPHTGEPLVSAATLTRDLREPAPSQGPDYLVFVPGEGNVRASVLDAREQDQQQDARVDQTRRALDAALRDPEQPIPVADLEALRALITEVMERGQE